jgi:hypothetical protein
VAECCVSFEVGIEFLNTIYVTFDFEGLMKVMICMITEACVKIPVKAVMQVILEQGRHPYKEQIIPHFVVCMCMYVRVYVYACMCV